MTVVDEVTAERLEGATVYWVDAEGSGMFETDADGTGNIDSDGPVDVHVFMEGYNYVSVIDLRSDNLLLTVPPVQRVDINEIRDGFVCEDPGVIDDTGECGEDERSPCLCYDLENVDVVKGVPQFDRVANIGELKVSLNGFALGNTLLDLNFDIIVGPNIDRVFPDDSPIPLDDEAEIPSGVTISFNDGPIIESYIATAPAGERTLWSVGGVVSISDNPDLIPEIVAGVGGSLDIGPIIALVLPLFEDFYSGVAPGLTMDADGTFPVRDPGLLLNVPTQRAVDLTAPMLPEINGGWPDTAVVLSGALLPSEGFVPLGVTAAVDSPGDGLGADGILDFDADTDEIDPIPMRMAPIHGALSAPGTQYMFASVALELGDALGVDGDLASGIITVLDAGVELPETLDLSDTPFPTFAEGSTWSVDDRELSIVAPTTGSDLYRVVFKGSGSRNWVVYAPGDAESFTLPAPDDDLVFEDRTEREEVNVVAVTLRESSGVGYAQLLEANGTNIPDLFRYVTTFSNYPVQE